MAETLLQDVRADKKMAKNLQHTAISLFCGAGGCSYGFRKAGFDILYACDVNKVAVRTYQKNFPSRRADCADIRDINFHELLHELKLVPGQLDVLIGGPPCQGFSTAGSRSTEDVRNHLLASYVEALKVVQPKWFLMENVEGLLTADRGRYITEVAKSLIASGYKIRIEKVYAQEYGIPQRRKRVFILGNRMGLNFEMPAPQFTTSGKIFSSAKCTVADAIQDLPPAVQEQKELTTIEDHYTPSITNIQQARIAALKPGQTMKHLPEHLQHVSFKRRANRRVCDGTPTAKRGGAPSGLKRLRLNEPALTITGAATREFIHPTQDRPLTLRECARLQTFPDTFTFTGSDAERIKQIGNAIPPMLAYVFAQHISNVQDSAYQHRQAGSREGELIGINLTKAAAMSPALARTQSLLQQLTKGQLSLLENCHA